MPTPSNLKEREAKLKGEYPKIWAAIKFGSLTSMTAASMGLTVNLPTRCSDLERRAIGSPCL